MVTIRIVCLIVYPAYYLIKLAEVNLYVRGIDSIGATNLLSILIQIFIEQFQINTVKIVRYSLNEKLFWNLLSNGSKFMVREPSKVIDVLGCLKVSHFLLHFHYVSLAISHLHRLNEFVHIFEGVSFGFLFLFYIHIKLSLIHI